MQSTVIKKHHTEMPIARILRARVTMATHAHRHIGSRSREHLEMCPQKDEIRDIWRIVLFSVCTSRVMEATVHTKIQLSRNCTCRCRMRVIVCISWSFDDVALIIFGAFGVFLDAPINFKQSLTLNTFWIPGFHVQNSIWIRCLWHGFFHRSRLIS